MLPGDEAFKLYDTYGLPRDFIEDLASNQGLQFDAEGFAREMEGQREKARAKSAFSAKDSGLRLRLATVTLESEIRQLGPTPFVGYDRTGGAVRIERLLRLNETRQGASRVGTLSRGDEGYAILDETPFYLRVRWSGIGPRDHLDQ